MKTCEEMMELMSLYIDNELSLQELECFEKHLANCHNCKKDLKDLKQIVILVNNLEELELPENYHQQLVSKLNSEKNTKFKEFRKYTMASCMLLVFVSLFWFNNNLSESNIDNNIEVDFNRAISSPQNFVLEESNIDYGITRSYTGLENELFQEDIMPMVHYISYNIHLESEDIEETFYIINNFPGDMIFSSIDESYTTVGYFQKEVDINDYDYIKHKLTSLGTVISSEEIGSVDDITYHMNSYSTYDFSDLENKEIIVNIFVTVQEVN